MTKRILVRLGVSLVALVGASVLSFFLLRVAPGDPVGLVLGPFATDEARANLRVEMGLDLPVWQQYFHYMGDLLRGNWGYSYANGRDVRDLVAARLPASLELGFCALVFALLGAFVLGVVKSFSKKRALRSAAEGITFFGYSVPQYWLGLILLIVFSSVVHVFPGPEGELSPGLARPPTRTGFLLLDSLLSGNPAAFGNALWHLVLPSVTLGLFTMAYLSRIFGSNLDQARRMPFVRVSLSRGLSSRKAIATHVIPNAMVTSATAAGMVAGFILTGTTLVEKTFAWPGLGSLVTESIQRQDYAVVQAFIFFSAVVFVLVNLATDLLVSRIDPRLSVEDRR